MNASLTDAIDALLPQTQCTKCGYPGCRPYAEAIAGGLADINQCPPGGARGIQGLAMLLGREAKPLNPANGVEQPRSMAVIDEARCIGCMLCIGACPTDAIVGAAKQMHTVLTPYCTGCELCLPPCPVDCIDMVAVSHLAEAGSRSAVALQNESIPQMAALARTRQRSRTLRLERDAEELALRLSGRDRARPGHGNALAALPEKERKKAAVNAALKRARARRAASKP